METPMDDMTRYTITLPGDTITMVADLADAAAPICYETEDGELVWTQYQTADARHDAHEAAFLLVSLFGPDYYLDPNDEAEFERDPDAYIRRTIIDVSPEDDEPGDWLAKYFAVDDDGEMLKGARVDERWFDSQDEARAYILDEMRDWADEYATYERIGQTEYEELLEAQSALADEPDEFDVVAGGFRWVVEHDY